jgi:tight adherence protein B
MKGTSTAWMWCVVGASIACILVVGFILVGTKHGVAFTTWGRYVDYLKWRLRRLHVFSPPARIASAQIGAIFVLFGLTVFDLVPYWYLILVLVCITPAILLEVRVRERIAKIDAQADGFCLALANSLKSTASVGAAIDTAAHLMEGPVAQEMRLAIKETRVGRPLNEALQATGPRAGSHKLGTVLAAVLIGQRVGGNLPKVLETIAATLREMERLEGVLRQKTAESRMQMWAFTLGPPVICYAFAKLQPGYFQPLTTTTPGYIAAALATGLYVLGLVVARKTLQVNI